MSAQKTSKSSVLVWSTAVLVALFLYVATWPFVELRWGILRDEAPLGMDSTIVMVPVVTYLPWPKTVYRPLHHWRDHDEGRNLLKRYWDWWEKFFR